MIYMIRPLIGHSDNRPQGASRLGPSQHNRSNIKIITHILTKHYCNMLCKYIQILFSNFVFSLI